MASLLADLIVKSWACMRWILRAWLGDILGGRLRLSIPWRIIWVGTCWWMPFPRELNKDWDINLSWKRSPVTNKYCHNIVVVIGILLQHHFTLLHWHRGYSSHTLLQQNFWLHKPIASEFITTLCNEIDVISKFCCCCNKILLQRNWCYYIIFWRCWCRSMINSILQWKRVVDSQRVWVFKVQCEQMFIGVK